MATDKDSKSQNSAWGGNGGDGQNLAIGISIGLSLGVALSLVLDNWAFMGAGLAIGVAIGVSLDAAKKDKGTSETDAAPGPSPSNGGSLDDEPRPDGNN